MNKHDAKRKVSFKNWLKRFGLVGFMFFLAKGLLWLIVPFAAVTLACD